MKWGEIYGLTREISQELVMLSQCEKGEEVHVKLKASVEEKLQALRELIPQQEPSLVENVQQYLAKPPLPWWACNYAKGQFCLGALLETKDGRRIGNAAIYDLGPRTYHKDSDAEVTIMAYNVVTDIGTELVLNANEINEMFHPTRYVCTEEAVNERFKKPGEPRGH